ncbi:SpoIIE family protein phosphatase [Streptomyces sp. SRF1]|uniref:ATP-binding SpoIIE family protein phosphatase n=1 Tax=Streptomyces sp. SRF1 TaxID=1549642 RepID=UPI0025B13BCA|nr:SpoIIE family protein phosphatase [Streptomyces sp. SRF1]MDN3057981.1 SpoIIE family protein phosphatase [Streptomyces sp. SRF1]
MRSAAGAEGRTVRSAVMAAVVLDGAGTVLRWSQAAAELLGRTAEEVCGRPVRALFAESCGAEDAAAPYGAAIPAGARALLRHRSGGTVDVTLRVLPLEPSAEYLMLLAPTRQVTDWEHGACVLHALIAQDRIGIVIHDENLAVVRTNITPELFGGSAPPPGSRLTDVISPQDAGATEAALRQVLETGAPLIGRELRMRSSQKPEPQRVLSLSAFRTEGSAGAPAGVVALFTDTTGQQRARRELDLLKEAATRIGGSLDVTRTAQDLLDVLVPSLGSLGWVSLAEAVLSGDEPPKALGGGDQHLRRVASAGPYPSHFIRLGEVVPRLPYTTVLQDFQEGRPVIFDPESLAAALEDPAQGRLFVPEGAHSGMWAPLFARGLVLGGVTVWRTKQADPYNGQDADMLMEIASRAALSVDNARRYTREHRSVLALQQRLLPPATTRTPAAETAGLYLPAGGGADISGDWYDVIPLPSLRVALVVGDVIGHGLYATATMGRLRTAVRTLADVELDPTELLTHMDDLVQQFARETHPGHRDTVGGTCLYAVYDPVVRRCFLASAGHPPPVLIRPDGTVEVVVVPPGPPLGVGGLPFETTTIDLDPGSILALYTDGLITRDGLDVDSGLRRLTDRLAALSGPGRALDDIGRALLADLGDAPPRDDIAFLLARTRAVPAENTASWEFPADPAVVAEARLATTCQLSAWGLDELAFTTELIVSELVTNAVRYTRGPVGLRLIRNEVLVCEVIDPSNTQPRLRRARWTDEGGRGLFLVAQLSTRWGSRYSQHAGKTIWAEQSLAPGA